MNTCDKNKMIYIFLILTFVISWGIIFAAPTPYTDLVMFVPGGVALVLTTMLKEKLVQLFRLGDFITVLQGSLASFLAFILYIFLSSFFQLATFGLPEMAIEYNNGSSIKAWLQFLIFGFPYMLFINFLFAVCEEIGWRGYLQKKLSEKLNPFLLRSTIVGLIWAIWHIPIYLQSGMIGVKLPIFILNVCLISILYGWLFEQKKSIWPTSLAHAIHNTLFNSVLPTVTLSQSGSNVFFGEEGILVSMCYSLVILIGVYWVSKSCKKTGHQPPLG